MEWIVCAVMVLFVGGLATLLAGRRVGLACWLGPASALLACGLMFGQSLLVLARGEIVSLRAPWQVPLGSLRLSLDPLSAWFALLIALVGGLSAVYGAQYLRHQPHPQRVARSWFFFNLLLASMLLVVVARNGVFFLVAWETMSLASWFLVMFDSQEARVRRAGWIYLVATHLGAAFLMAMFALLGRESAALDFNALSATGGTASAVFLLALVGFGAKAGLIPLHVWLPEAHPAAPSHVSAVMSGVMIKMGIYGLLRILPMLGPPQAWWGWTLLGLGAVSGILGILYALAQSDLKRALAYSSVENIGIISLGLGVGLLGITCQCPAMAALGLAGSLLHVANHALMKSLLFLGAGAVVHATGTRQIDELGGLLKRMPVTGLAFLVAAVAICGLPPLNGFTGELLIYLAALSGIVASPRSADVSWPLVAILAVGGLALIGGLAAACFTRVFGMVFLGEPRTAPAAHAHEAGRAMRLVLCLLAAGCLAMALLGPWVLDRLVPLVAGLIPHDFHVAAEAALASWRTALVAVAAAALVLMGLVALLVLGRRRLFAGRTIEQAGTWDCGYVAPSPRMQYTGSSFGAPLLAVFRLFIRPRVRLDGPRELFPRRASFESHLPDVFVERLFRPLFQGVAQASASLRWFQQGRIQLYVLYIAVTLLVLLIWKLG